MKLKIALVLAVLCLTVSTGANAAGFCGAGKILSIKEGGWGSNHFMITIDYSEQADQVEGLFNNHIRFLASLNANRFRGIKALAYMAFSGNKTVQVYTSGANCGVADDITIYAAGQSPFGT